VWSRPFPLVTNGAKRRDAREWPSRSSLITYITYITSITSITISHVQPKPSDPAPPDVFDLLVIGGGINGVGIARDAVGRGLKVALVEQSDLGSATSSASTKLIHGGLRYLEQFEFRLVRESLIERECLLKLAPHLIFPMQFVLPHVPGLRPRWQIRLGLFLYDRMAGRQTLPSSHGLNLDAEPYRSTLQDGLRYGFVYSDCSVDDARLVILNAVDAAERGAAIFTRTKFISARNEHGLWRALCEDRGSGKQSLIRARSIVNVAGPWVEDVLADVPDVEIAARIRLVKGSHIVVPRLYEGAHAFLLQNPDGRVVFAIPYEQAFTMIGTTDIPYAGDPSSAAITDEETRYLCETASRYFRNRIDAKDVRWTFAGVRPLVDDDTADVSKVTRDYRLELAMLAGEAPLLSVFGGKLTTYRRLSIMALEKLLPVLGGDPREWTGTAPLPGGDFPGADFATFLHDVRARWPYLSERLAYRLARAYGTRIARIVGAARRMEDLGRDFGAGLTEAEVSYLRTREWAQTAEDILWRRTKLGLHMTPSQQASLAEYLSKA
jgi:glycerol-3-phosphate dehydrogenase